MRPFFHPDVYNMSPGSHFTQNGGFGIQGFRRDGDSIDPSELTVRTGGVLCPLLWQPKHFLQWRWRRPGVVERVKRKTHMGTACGRESGYIRWFLRFADHNSVTC